MKKYSINQSGHKIGDGSIRAFIDWVESFIAALYGADNPFEYFASGTANHVDFYKKIEHGGLDKVVSWVSKGACEGYRLEMGVVLKDGQYFNLAWGKAFGRRQQLWEAAAIMMEALEDVFHFQEVPMLPEYYAAAKPLRLYGNKKAIMMASNVGYLVKVDDFEIFRKALPLDEQSLQAEFNDWEIVFKALEIEFSGLSFATDQKDQIIFATLENDTSKETVEFKASEVLAYHMPGSAHGWDDLSDQDKISFSEDYALFHFRRSKGDMEAYRVDVEFRDAA